MDYSDNVVLDAELKEYIEGCEAARIFWNDRVPMMVMEECAELIQAISKFNRHMNPETSQDLIDEIGDVYISLEMLRQYYKIPLPAVKKRIFDKLDRRYDEE